MVSEFGGTKDFDSRPLSSPHCQFPLVRLALFSATSQQEDSDSHSWREHQSSFVLPFLVQARTVEAISHNSANKIEAEFVEPRGRIRASAMTV